MRCCSDAPWSSPWGVAAQRLPYAVCSVRRRRPRHATRPTPCSTSRPAIRATSRPPGGGSSRCGSVRPRRPGAASWAARACVAGSGRPGRRSTRRARDCDGVACRSPRMTVTQLEIPYHSPAAACARLQAAYACGAGLVLLESARRGDPTGRHSYLAADPYRTLDEQGRSAGLGRPGRRRVIRSPSLETLLARDRRPMPSPGLPPFQGGAAGVFGYELAQHLERVPLAARGSRRPGSRAGVLRRRRRLRPRRGARLARLERSARDGRERASPARGASARRRSRPGSGGPSRPCRSRRAARPVACTSGLLARRVRAARRARVIEHILAGDIFQANLSQRFRAPCAEPPFDALPSAVPGQPRAVRRLRRAGRPRRRLRLAGALPAPRRPPRRDAPDQGDAPAASGRRRRTGSRPRRCSPARRTARRT